MEEQYQLLANRLRRLYDELVEAERQLHPALTRLRRALGEFLGIEPTPIKPKPEEIKEQPTMFIPEAWVKPIPTPPPKPRVTIEDLLLQILAELRKGVVLRPYTEHKFVIAKEPITYEGNAHDLGGVYDLVIVMPTIDCKIEINKNVEEATPVIGSYTEVIFRDIPITKIYYKSVTPGLVGTMNIWAFRRT